MSEIYDNWDRLVRATLRKEQLRISALRTPSDLSVASPSSAFTSPAPHVSSFNISGLLVGESFTYNQILQATDHLNISNLIAHGHSGYLFYGVLEDGLQVVVKRIDLSSVNKESYLKSELEIFGKVSHPRFVPLLGHCLDNWKEKFLVYKYMPNSDLSSCLYNRVRDSDDNVDCPSTTLDWLTRLKIAKGVAQGLFYLHHECVPPLVHRNIGASSILIDENYEAQLGRLNKVCTEEKDRNQNRISRFLRVPKDSERDASGTLNAMCAYDVYCFGKVLLELVTGNSGFSNYSGSNLKDLIENTLCCITIDNKDLFVSIMDPSLEVDDHVFIEVWAIAVVAKACLSPKPSKRPKMIYILEALENPTLVRLSTYGSPLHAGLPGRVSSTPAEGRISKGYTPGVMADAKFQFKIHYGGQFLMFGANNSYVGGKFSYAESTNLDHMSLIKLMGIVEDLGFSTDVKLYHLLPDADMDGGLRILMGDNDVLDMLAINAGRETINLYVEHFFLIDRNHGAEPAEANNGTSQATCNVMETVIFNSIRDLPELRIYSFSELKYATKNFRSDRVLGEGRFGTVYKGWHLEMSRTKYLSGSSIAVKRLKPERITGLQESKTVIAMIGRHSHPNIVKLLGYCHKKHNLFFVYEYMQKGSLANHLFQCASSVGPLPWDIRLKILIGAARGLAFLHTPETLAIYGDFKASSILLDADYNAKISDFGMAKMFRAGDYGYAGPEYIATGQLSVKSDVYSFGVVLAEVLTGLRNLDNNRPVADRNLIDWIKPCLSNKRKIKSIMDPQLQGKYPLKAAAEMAKLSHICLASEYKARPSMKEVVDALERIESAD